MVKVRMIVGLLLLLVMMVPGSLAHAQVTGGVTAPGGTDTGDNTQISGSNTAPNGCTQSATGGGAATGAPVTNTQDSTASQNALVQVIDVMIDNVHAVDLNNLNLNALNGANVHVVCLNDVLNQNDIRVLQDILNGSPVLNNLVNGSLNNLLQNADIALLNNVQVIAVNVGQGQVFALRRG